MVRDGVVVELTLYLLVLVTMVELTHVLPPTEMEQDKVPQHSVLQEDSVFCIIFRFNLFYIFKT
jgi:hypothetical protein